MYIDVTNAGGDIKKGLWLYTSVSRKPAEKRPASISPICVFENFCELCPDRSIQPNFDFGTWPSEISI
jgi:hypothetical protein